ncbi:MAG: peptidylprolyl isomerase [Bacteroidales bacterium]|nr:peptidylprolyl isomerase [Bacteroidales bacterium]
MKVRKDHVVAVSYELHVEGSLADKAASDAPLEYIHGSGMLLPKFEASLEEKEPGDTFEFTLSPEEGYGKYDPRYLVSVPIEAFQVQGKLVTDLLVPGRILPMLNGAGQVVRGTIKEVAEDHVLMDFNHPMAGKTLNFSGKVESVRPATEKELKEGLHGEYLPPEEDEGGCPKGKKCHKGECHKEEGGCDCKEGGDCNCDGDCGK